ncbi:MULTISPECIES: DMT family transporter [Aminobacter]|jgi:drug/metabolite transporter (DMT)-like permease|uniref:Drug/metabolite transporter (DMT)-like permease n=1 Tax=Aminobacter ciceronei TaxID=150723 RepID=A0ABR6CD11_9HYPH|nr:MULTISPECIES: DMT family transporter [Aminobacter]MBA8908525.1 drug/metabolite transporter (DMT)-like permease [Aminobacter ciceronei]MBA9022302.1 drug/metabolite transporter (DMT)-like permease [Aminobacter ciceronei]MRX35159.1 EamA family transporter [Aminobacter sp. MDW-2]QNH36100.1 DMT family transporter [Aminobacter sp. MDW-2]BBD39732.1 membrane protein [Aminobacter sp. SS-2016]
MHNRTLLGILCLCLGVLVFSIQDALIKAVAGTYPVSEALLIRAVVALPILLLLVHRDVGLPALASPNWRFLATRSTILFVSYCAYYLAIPALPIADAAALFFLTPLLIMTMAGPYLGEPVPWQSLAAGTVGLFGVVIMVNPGAGIFEWAALLSLASAFLYSFSQLMARKVGVTESATTMAFYQNAAYLFGAVLITTIFSAAGFQQTGHPSLDFLMRPWIWPSLRDFLMMGACGIIAAVGMVLLGQAYRLTPANKAATFEYTGLLWAPLWGFLLFAEVPGTGTVIGALLIVGAGIFALNVGTRTPQAAPASATAD